MAFLRLIKFLERAIFGEKNGKKCGNIRIKIESKNGKKWRNIRMKVKLKFWAQTVKMGKCKNKNLVKFFVVRFMPVLVSSI